jgi:hypothetical protein
MNEMALHWKIYSLILRSLFSGVLLVQGMSICVFLQEIASFKP